MSTEENVKKLGSLIKGIKVAMLTTVAQDGSLRSRPMATQEREFDGTLWFFTQAGAPKVSEVGNEERVNLSYADPDKERYVSVSGTARVVRDPARIKELWSPLLKAWFPKGPDDPQTALLRIDVDRAEYWDDPSSTMVHLVGMAKALATGQPYRPGENEKLDLHQPTRS
ncbi:MAG TPA: pyridoxamine 5'-phosphate oxidase family protein [Gemmataceae bacterium]|nr:pyridoxamine 5'-phosphate oxidase family protein [Gemmataceae bacterium]